ncbi:hypothetical protein WUBG_11828, partial [Wuchereria bancrofti]
MTERCNELRDNKASEKRQKDDDDKYVTKACKGSCPFARSDAIEDLCDQILASKLSSTPQLVDYSKKISACPYFASRKSVAYSQLVLLPYQILFQEEARKAWGIELKGNVIVIDEAHNFTGDNYEFTFCYATRKRIENLVYLTRFQSRLTPVHKKYLRQLSTIVDLLLAYMNNALDKNKDYVETMTSFAGKACLAQYKLDILLKYIEETHLIMKLSKFSKRLDEQQNKKVDSGYVFPVEQLLRKKDSSNESQSIFGSGLL